MLYLHEKKTNCDYILDDDEASTAFNAKYKEDPESLIRHYTDATIPKELRVALEGPDGVPCLKAW